MASRVPLGARKRDVTKAPRAAMPLVERRDGETLIVLAPGAVHQVRAYLARVRATRAYVVTGASLGSGSVGDRVRNALGDALVGLYARSRPHVPGQTVDEVVREAASARADVLLGLGGGSPIGTAKAAAFRLLESGRGASTSSCIVAAIPTTYSGSEVTPFFGTTDLEQGRKSVSRSDPIRPRLALYDPELALDTPTDLTAATGVNALAHCVEALYAKEATDVDRSMSLRAAGRLIENLPLAVREPRDLPTRYRLFEGSMEAGLVLAKVGMGVHHGLCHVLGGRYRAPHGVLNGIVLPHAMRFNLLVAGAAYRDLARPFGLEPRAADIGEEVCDAVFHFVRGLGLPTRLRDLGIPKADLPSVAEAALSSRAVQANPRPVTLQGALGILEAAW
jgi:maleylacetate reductase